MHSEYLELYLSHGVLYISLKLRTRKVWKFLTRQCSSAGFENEIVSKFGHLGFSSANLYA